MSLNKIIGAIIVNPRYGTASLKIENKIARLKEEFSALNVSIDVIKNDGSLIFIKDNKLYTSLKPYDFIIYLDKDKYACNMLMQYGFKVFNKPSFIELCDDKMLSHIAVSKLGISTPNTMSCPLAFFKDNDDSDIEVINKAIDQLSLPMVLKTVYGSLGEGVNKVDDFASALDAYRKVKGTPCFFQQYIPSNNSSIRVLVIDKKIVYAIERINEIDFRSNAVNSCSSSRPFNMSKEFIADVNKMIDALDIEYAGLDFIISNNKHYFLEMNSNAFFSEVEKVSGINIAKLYAQYVLNNIENLKK